MSGEEKPTPQDNPENTTSETPGLEDFLHREIELPAPEAPKPEKQAEAPKEEVKTEAPASTEASEKEGFESYKRLSRFTKINYGGKVLDIFGQALFTVNPYKPRDSLAKNRVPLAFPTLTAAGVNSYTSDLISKDYDRDAQARQWGSTLESSMAFVNTDDALIRALNRPGSEWGQSVLHGNRHLIASTAKMPAYTGRELKDSQAVLYAMSSLNLGAPVQKPMWQSGFWVTFRPASEESWVNFNERLASDKIRFGRHASGLIFSNLNTIFVERALEFAADHMVETNIRFEGVSMRDSILDLLLEPDISSFLWGFLCANYPSGYPISRSCTADVKECSNVIEDMVNLSILQVTDSSAIDERGRAHMSKSHNASVTVKEVQEYQSSLLLNTPRTIEIFKSESIEQKAIFKIPTARERIAAGRRWIDGIIDMANKIVAKDATDRQREQLYTEYAKSSILREYSHFISELEINTNVIRDQQTLENVLTETTPHEEMRRAIYEKVRDYIEDSTISMIAIPNYHCPVCEGPQDKEADKRKRFVNCIPLDVLQAFFSLAMLRITEIRSR